MNAARTNAPEYAVLTSRFTSSGQWDRALSTAQEWLSADPENSDAHLNAGWALIQLGRHAEAEPHISSVLAGNPSNDFAHRLMSIIHFSQKRFKLAGEAIQKALSLNPTERMHWYHAAWMCHQHGDMVSARKFAAKARALDPRDAAIINLLAICGSDDSDDPARQLEQYREALALDPENADVHNNIGVYHLNVTKDYAAAEDCFRRALFFDPSSKTSRSNLFTTLKHRDVVYQVLCLPKDALLKLASLLSETRERGVFIYILLLLVWILLCRFVVGGLILWWIFVWPTIKVYQYLTIGDIRAKAGEIGARRGGLFGFRRWPLRVRLAVFAAALVAFWSGVALLARNEEYETVLWATVGCFVSIVAVRFVYKAVKDGWAKANGAKRAKELNTLIETANTDPAR